MHVDCMLSLCSQRVFVMKRLRDQSLAEKYLYNVFQAIIVTRILYALPAWGCYLRNELPGRMDAYLKRCYRYGFSSKIECVDILLDTACMELFNTDLFYNCSATAFLTGNHLSVIVCLKNCKFYCFRRFLLMKTRLMYV